MTNVRDPGPRMKIDVKDADRTTKTRRSQAVQLPAIVTRALKPLWRPAPAPAPPRNVALRSDDPFSVQPKTKLRPVLWSFVLLVFVPTALFGGYLFFVASDQYVAEARFAVRPVDPDIGGSSAGSLSLGANDEKSKSSSSSPVSTASPLGGVPNLGSENAEIVANYIHSRAIVDDVSRSIDIRAIFRRPEADFYARLERNASVEDLVIYWNKMVSVYIETTSGIVTLSVSAFRREDALQLAQAILKSSDKLVNSLSDKVRADAMKTAEDEVRRSDGEVRFALAGLTTFRNSHRLIDPMQTSESTGKLLLKVLSDKIETEGKLYVAQRAQGPNAPGINLIKSKLDGINEQVVQLQQQMAGNQQVSKNLAATLAEYEGLELKKQFAERMYGFARDGVERARIAAIRQSVYLAVFVPPSLPQEYSYPLRITDFLLLGIACLMVWSGAVTITASVLDHRL